MECFLSQYVPEELVEVYRDELVPMADILTPNDFEAGYVGGGGSGNVT
jgi:pyridoxine kinase